MTGLKRKTTEPLWIAGGGQRSAGGRHAGTYGIKIVVPLASVNYKF